MEKGKVSIIVPCYNQSEYLSEALDSVLAQTYSNWECVIVNDGSPDNTEVIARQYLERDIRFRYISKINGGLASARNIGIANSHGEYILPLDADDLIAPSYLKKAIERFSVCPETKLVYCKADKFGAINEAWNLDEYVYDRFIWKNCIFCSAIYKRIDFDRTNGYNSNMINGLEDWDFWLSLLNRYDSVYCINEVLFHYRIKHKSRSTELSNHYSEAMFIQLYKNHSNIYELYKDRVVLYQNRIFELEESLHNLKKVYRSKAYRIGKIILKPFLILKKIYK